MKVNNITKYVETFFKSCEVLEKLEQYSYFLIRHDGVVLYHNKNLYDFHSKSSIGALLGGVWQAAEALSGFIAKPPSQEIYRLSFDTSSQGVYIVPIGAAVGPEVEKLYLGLIYSDEVNPGLIKNLVREMAINLEKYLEQYLINVNENNDFLFGEISDHEMDSLFAFVKN